MDLLNYQYLDKMNNNIGILCYEGNAFVSQSVSCRVCFLLFLSMKCSSRKEIGAVGCKIPCSLCCC